MSNASSLESGVGPESPVPLPDQTRTRRAATSRVLEHGPPAPGRRPCRASSAALNRAAAVRRAISGSHERQLVWKSQESEEIAHGEGGQLGDASAADPHRDDGVGLMRTPHDLLAVHRYRW